MQASSGCNSVDDLVDALVFLGVGKDPSTAGGWIFSGGTSPVEPNYPSAAGESGGENKEWGRSVFHQKMR